jgi:octopine/nopaline transport system permease protein
MTLDVLLKVFAELAGALPMTLALAACSIPVSLAVASALTWARLSGMRALGWVAEAYVVVFRSTPLLVQIFLLYYGLSQFPWLRASPLWTVLREPFWCAILALGFCSGAYVAEVMRGGLKAVPASTVEAARSLGLGRRRAFFLVTAPLALRQGLPAYANEVIVLLKGTSLASTITVMEVTGTAKHLMSETFAVVEVFAVAALLYLAASTGLILLFRAWEESLRPAYLRGASAGPSSPRNPPRRAPVLPPKSTEAM